MSVTLEVKAAGDDWNCDVCERDLQKGEKCVTLECAQGPLADICVECVRALFVKLKKEAP